MDPSKQPCQRIYGKWEDPFVSPQQDGRYEGCSHDNIAVCYSLLVPCLHHTEAHVCKLAHIAICRVILDASL